MMNTCNELERKPTMSFVDLGEEEEGFRLESEDPRTSAKRVRARTVGSTSMKVRLRDKEEK